MKPRYAFTRLTLAPVATALLTLGLLLWPGMGISAAAPLATLAPLAPLAKAVPRLVFEGVINASDLTFHHRVLASKVPVLVGFWAPWCLPCRGLEAPMARVAADLGNQVRIVRVNISWNQLYARRYKVEALPTSLVFMDGRLVDRSTGVLSADDIRGLLESAGGPPRPSLAAAAAAKVAALLPAGS